MAKKRKQNKTKGCKRSRWNLDELDWAIIDEVLRQPSITDRVLAQKFGYTRQRIQKRRSSPQVQLEIANLKRDFITQTRELIAKSLIRAGKILDKGEDKDAKTIAIKLINGLPEIATGVLKPEHDTTDEPTAEEIDSLQEYQEETKKRSAPDQSGAS